MKEKYGFVYIWYDRKRKMYYIGSHWGTEYDGYICSSNRMRNAFRRRPQDFKRRILSYIYTNRSDLLLCEQMWFDKVKIKDRYYNLQFETTYQWWADPNHRETVGQRISAALKGKKQKPRSKEHCSKISERMIGNTHSAGNVHSEETRKKLSDIHTGKTMSDEARAKMSASHKGKPSPRKGKKSSDETKAKISASKKGVPWSPEVRERMMEARRKKRDES